MKAMIFAAGLGTRLKPLTDTMPKALVPVGGTPMLEHVILKLKKAGFTEVVINVHHFAEQIVAFLKEKQDFGLTIHISDERGALLDTGGGISKAREFLARDERPFLVHNVDILSDLDLGEVYRAHVASQSLVTLVASRRETSRYLLFDEEKRLRGWINRSTGQTKPEGLVYDEEALNAYAFSGMHVLSPAVFEYMDRFHFEGKFSIIDFYLAICGEADLSGYLLDHLSLMDIGKPETLPLAEEFLRLHY